MRDFINIGPTPFEEDCAQVGSPNYQKEGKEECLRFCSLLQRMYPAGVFKVKSFPHDFGSYYEVVAYFDTENEEQEEAAFEAESCEYGTWEELEEALEREGR